MCCCACGFVQRNADNACSKVQARWISYCNISVCLAAWQERTGALQAQPDLVQRDDHILEAIVADTCSRKSAVETRSHLHASLHRMVSSVFAVQHCSNMMDMCLPVRLPS